MTYEAMETITTKITGECGWITIDRPDKRNALSDTVISEIGQVLDDWESNSAVRGIVFTGAGDKAFVAGADIAQLKNYDIHYGLQSSMQKLFDRIENYPKPSIAAINGVALGGGLELAMSCDLRIAVEGASMGLPELTLGVLPGAGGTQRLTRLVGRGRAVEMILTSKLLTAQQAADSGLITEVTAPGQLEESTSALMQTILSKGPLAVRLAKLVITRGGEVDQTSGLLLETLAQTLLYTTADKAEGAAAFLEKRKPDFRGH